MTSNAAAALVCFACTARPRSVGLLCGECAEGLVGDADLCPEQITARAAAPGDVAATHNAWLIDGFGLPHAIVVDRARPGASANVGRARRSDVVVAERSVSQSHAVLEHRDKSNVWFVADAGSDNGTFVNDERVERRFPLEPLDRVFVGRRVGFVFVPLDEENMPRAHIELRWLKAQAASIPTRVDAGLDPGVVLRVAAVTEGGAVATWADERQVLSELEYELLVVLHKRYVAEAERDDAVRGFVPAQQLLDALSFRSEAPTHVNLRGLVRKLRKKLADGDPPLDVVESRQGLGYRLARPIVLS